MKIFGVNFFVFFFIFIFLYMKIFIFLYIKKNWKGIYVTNSWCVVFTNSEKLQKQGTTCFQICTTEKQLFQNSYRKAEPFWFSFCFLKAEAGSESWTKRSLKAGGEVLLHLYCSESYFWTKAPRAFEPFGWLLAFVKAKAGWKAQPNTPLGGRQWCSMQKVPKSISNYEYWGSYVGI
jgi:hypothetical protein